MRRSTLLRSAGIAAAMLIAIGAAGSAAAATLNYTGSLTLRVMLAPPYASLAVDAAAAGSGSAVVNAGPLATLALAGTLGPITTSVPVTNNQTINSVIFTNLKATGGTPLVGGVGAPMGLIGSAKVCLVFLFCRAAGMGIPLTPTPGGAGFGIGGTQTLTGTWGGVNLTLQHAPWTIGQPVMTIHSPSSNVTSPALPGGFAHGPASVTSSTAQPSGVLQLVTVTKAFSSLTGAFPEFTVVGILSLHLVPEPGTLVLLGSGVGALALLGRVRRRR